MVTKEILKQYTSLLEETKELRERIVEIERQIKKIEDEGPVVDKVSGGEGGNQHFRIEGFPYPEYSRKKTLLLERKRMLENLEAKVDGQINDIQEFLDSITDSFIRRIITLRIVDHLTWDQVAARIGGGNSENSVKKIYQRYLDANT